MRGRLTLQRAGWICESCSSGYPVVGGVPWLFADPQAMLAEWRGRLGFLLLELEREAQALHATAASVPAGSLTAKRLTTLASANEDHARRLKLLLTPLGVADSKIGYETHLALRTRLPLDQGLTNYYVNLHRDWSWGDAENAAALAAVTEVAGNGYAWGPTTVLGAGAGRLAYDIHMQCGPTCTIAADFNPLLLFVARDVTQGGVVELYEFPIAPRTIADHAVLRPLQAPAPVRAGFEVIGADALRLPFADGALRTVVTPWLIDIIDEDLGRFASRLNQALAPGGSWINFGSLSFTQRERAHRLSHEESLEVVASAGFAVQRQHEAPIPYMQSPASRHARVETAVAWCAVKERSVPAPAEHSRLPEWLLRPDQPVPLSQEFQVQSFSTRIHAFLMALIDGKRSVRDMARVLVEQRLMTPEEAEPAIRGFLARMHADARH